MCIYLLLKPQTKLQLYFTLLYDKVQVFFYYRLKDCFRIRDSYSNLMKDIPKCPAE